MYKIVKGINLFESETFISDYDNGNNKSVLIPHIVNNVNAWGAGFVKALNEYVPGAKNKYYEQMTAGQVLGDVGYYFHKVNLGIANMIAQNGIGTDKRRVDYIALARCIESVRNFCLRTNTMIIHAPKFGAGLGGGDWNVIEALIQDGWVKEGISVTVYEL